jgi:hypothetical protein
MRQRLTKFAILVFVVMAAQGTADALLWVTSGRPVSVLKHITEGTGLLTVILLAVATVTVACTHRLGRDEFTYLWILLVSYLCAAIEAVVIVTSSPVSQGGSRHFHWTVLFVLLWIAGAAIVTTLSILAVRDIVNGYAVSYLLDIVSRLFRGLSVGYGTVGGRLSDEEVLRAVPVRPPGGEPRELPVAGLAAALARGDAWAAALFAQNRETEPRRGVPAPAATEVGFVRRRKGTVEMAVVNYYAPAFLFRAMTRLPRKVNCRGEDFWLVVRPWLPVGRGRYLPFDGHCWVTFGAEAEKLGVVTASRLLDEAESETSGDARTASSLTELTGWRRIRSRARSGSARTVSSRTELIGTVLKESKTMKTALLEVDRRWGPRLEPVPNTKKAGFGPIRLCVGHAEFDGFVVGLTDCSLGGFAETNPRDEPTEIAGVSFTVFAARGGFSEIGDAGSLVLDTINERAEPYLLYLESILLGPMQEERGVLLQQVSHHWQVNTQLNRSLEFNS